MEAVGWPPSAVLRFVWLHRNEEEENKTAEGGHPTLQAERESLSLHHILRSQVHPQSECLAALSADQTLSDPVRQRALPFARDWKP